MADVNTELAAAEAARTDRTETSAFNLEGKHSRFGKALFGVYKSASGIMKANGDAASSGDKILARFGVANVKSRLV